MKENGKVGSVFWISLAITALFVAWGAAWPAHLGQASARALSFIIAKLGWFYLVSVLLFLGFTLVLAIGPCGRIRLGPPGERPDYPLWTWFAMLFCAGMAIGLVFWGVAEPITHYASPPPGSAAPRSPEAARVAIQYSFFHWGLHPWATYAVVGLAVAYAKFRKRESGLISATFRPLLGRHVEGGIGKGIDVFASLATVFGVAASLGLGAMQINGGLNYLFGKQNGAGAQLLIIAVIMVMYTSSALSGIDRGIRLLSHFNLVLALALLLFVIVSGPAAYILASLASGAGGYLANLVAMSLPVGGDGAWVGKWTVFYWAWWIAWAPAVGVFIARISRGRTIREFVLGVLAAPTVLSMIWFAGFGGSALSLEMVGQKGIAAAVEKDVASAFFMTLHHFPLPGLLSVSAVVLIAIFFVTSADSMTFVLGMFTSGGTLNPRFRVKLLWGVLLAAIAAILLVTGGLQPAQTACLVGALPFTVIMLLMLVSLAKALRSELKEQRLAAKEELVGVATKVPGR
jgi:glycine betaine transporter